MCLDFIAIDFETANEQRASACAVALIFFKKGKVFEEYTWLIRPAKEMNYFSPFNVQIHGINKKDVQNEPEFNEIWPEIFRLINNRTVVAHNASFDISVMRQLIDRYGLDHPNINIICTCSVAKKTWQNQINYRLNTIGDSLGIVFKHHDAHDDAKTCGKILVEACSFHNSETFEDLAANIGMRIGNLNAHSYSGCSVAKQKKKVNKKLDFII